MAATTAQAFAMRTRSASDEISGGPRPNSVMAQYFFTRMRRRILHGILFDHEAEVIHDRAPLREVPE